MKHASSMKDKASSPLQCSPVKGDMEQLEFDKHYLNLSVPLIDKVNGMAVLS